MSPTLSGNDPVPRALLGAALDYAGLFPPAALSLPAALAEYRAASRSPERWLLSRFVIPADRLAQLGELLDGEKPEPADPLPLAVLLGQNGIGGSAAFPEIPCGSGRGARVEAVEVRVDSPAGVQTVLDGVPGAVACYVELAPEPGLELLLDLLAERGGRAKIRTGGTTQEAFPPPALLAAFIRRVADRRLPWKATAGLHHPLRGEYPLTYAPGAAAGTMYGYLNLLLAALVAWRGAGEPRIAAALEERDPGALHDTGADLTWRGDTWNPAEIREMRTRFFHGFGSCSFREPVAEWPL